MREPTPPCRSVPSPDPRPVLATHGGTFHLDDTFAYAVLRFALGLGAGPGEDHALVRTRDEAAIAGADVVWDVGTTYDPEAGRFDHHQRGAPVREDGTPFSAAGLVWRRYGEAAVRALLEPGHTDLARAVAAAVEREVVRRIDEIDNGVGEPGDALGLSAAVEDLNPAWDSPAAGDRAAEDAAFVRAAGLVEAFLRRRAEAVRARLAANGEVVAAHARSPDPRVLELGRKMPWEETVHARGLPVLYAVYPVPNGNWMVDAMPTEPGGFAQRLPLPEVWAGLRGAELARVCGAPDAVFVHLGRFVGAARSREGALAMARRAIEIGAAVSAAKTLP